MSYQAKRKSKTAGQPRTYRGKKVEDNESKDFNFIVTNDDCRRGTANDPQTCAAARAIKRTHPGEVLAVHVHRNVTMVEMKNKVIRYQTPHGLRDQLIRFDASNKFDAGKYKIGKVPPSKIKARGKQHSPPDRARGNPDNARDKVITLQHDVGRKAFTFNSENSDFRD